MLNFILTLFLIHTATFSTEIEELEVKTQALDVYSDNQSLASTLKQLEEDRDQSEWIHFSRFKIKTDEICAIIAIPVDGDPYEGLVLHQQEHLHRWIDSIIRTRYKFKNQPCLGKHSMVSRYTQNYPSKLNYLYEQHLATIMMIDAITKKAIDDDTFYEMWKQITPISEISSIFIKKIIDALDEDLFTDNHKPYRIKAIVRSIAPTNHSLIRLAGDIFNLHAPKLNLSKIYQDLIVSCGIYRGWNISGLDSFADILQTQPSSNYTIYAKFFLKNLNYLMELYSDSFDLYASSPKGIFMKPDSGDKKNLIRIEYIFKFYFDIDSIIRLSPSFLQQNLQQNTINKKDTLKLVIERPIDDHLIHLASHHQHSHSLLESLVGPIIYDSEEYMFEKGVSNISHDLAKKLIKKSPQTPERNNKYTLHLIDSFYLGSQNARITLSSARMSILSFLMEEKRDENEIAAIGLNILRENYIMEAQSQNSTILLREHTYSVGVMHLRNKNIWLAIRFFEEAIDLGFQETQPILQATYLTYASQLEDQPNRQRYFLNLASNAGLKTALSSCSPSLRLSEENHAKI